MYELPEQLTCLQGEPSPILHQEEGMLRVLFLRLLPGQLSHTSALGPGCARLCNSGSSIPQCALLQS